MGAREMVVAAEDLDTGDLEAGDLGMGELDGRSRLETLMEVFTMGRTRHDSPAVCRVRRRPQRPKPMARRGARLGDIASRVDP